MGIKKTTCHIQNGNELDDNMPDVNEKRLVLLIEDVYSDLTVENAVQLKVIIESWLRTNGVILNQRS